MVKFEIGAWPSKCIETLRYMASLRESYRCHFINFQYFKWRVFILKIRKILFCVLFQASVNELCMLYLNSVTKKEKGNFSCYLNDVIIQQNKVIVDVVYAEVTQAWWRHIVYLLYVIFLCMIIIIGGCVIGCLQMGNFKKVKTEDVIEMYATRRMEYEKLLPAE